jgi:hypothetical protein
VSRAAISVAEPISIRIWSEPTTFAGLTAGEHWVGGVRYVILDPHVNGGRWAVRLGAEPVTLKIAQPARRVYLFGSHHGIAGATGPAAGVVVANGQTRPLALTDAGVVDSGWPLSRWVLRCLWAEAPEGVTSIKLTGSWHLFAVTVEQ